MPAFFSLTDAARPGSAYEIYPSTVHGRISWPTCGPHPDGTFAPACAGQYPLPFGSSFRNRIRCTVRTQHWRMYPANHVLLLYYAALNATIAMLREIEFQSGTKRHLSKMGVGDGEISG